MRYLAAQRRNLTPGSLASGAALVSTLIVLLLALGWARPIAFWILLPVCGWGLYRAGRPRITGLPLWAAVILTPYLGLYLWHALSPEVQTDSLQYHLRLAYQTRLGGGFPDDPSFYNLIPQGMETLFAFAFALGGERAAKLLHLCFLLASVPLMVHIARQLRIGPHAAWAAAVFYFVTPVVGITATCTFNDAALAFVTMALFSLLLARRDTEAGLCAGFCYAIKFTGGFAALAGLVAILLRGRYRRALRYCAAAALVAVPWMLRAAWLTGNPVAPLFNRWFPNAYFHIETEQKLGQFLRNYGEIEWSSIVQELTLYGDLLHGLLAPGWLAAPVALLALRRKEGRLLLLAAVIAVLPWFWNAGARFLIPALPFAALALFLPLPRLAITVLAVTQAIVSWPAVVRLYAPQGAWVLPIPPEKTSELRDLAALVQTHTRPWDRVLDLADTPAAITRRQLVSGWRSAQGDRIARALQLAVAPDTALYEVRSPVRPRRVDAIRIRFPMPHPAGAAIHDVRIFDGEGRLLPPGRNWSLEAWPNIWEAAWGPDQNTASAWRTWEPVQPGMFFEIDTAVTIPVSEVRVVLSDALPVELWEDLQTWTAVPLSAPERLPLRNRRPDAGRYLKREGITHIVAGEGNDTFGRIGRDLATVPADWGLERAAKAGIWSLYRVR